MRGAGRILVLLIILAAAPLAQGEPGAPTLDAAARVDYGWLTGDAAMIDAARDSLENQRSDPWAAYLRAYASYRASQLALAGGRPAGSSLEQCNREASQAVASQGVAAESELIAAEAELIIAACAALSAVAEPLRAVLHQRRFRQALGRAASLDGDNPRFALIRLRYADPSELTVEAVVEAFRARRGRYGFPDWGEAEALVLLGAERLDAGDRRGARDLIEEALLIAPDYTEAKALARRLAAQTAAN